MSDRLRLLGRVLVRAELQVKSGLAIGGEGLAGLSVTDGAVVRDPLSGEPYVPGSSLKGKLRALIERAVGASLAPISAAQGPGGAAQGRRVLRLHRCASEKEYREAALLTGYSGCPVCHLFGIAPEGFTGLPTRLVTRDAALTEASRAVLLAKRTELPFTEVKTESALDRLTAAATPRWRERVPAGAVFAARWDLSFFELGGVDLKDERLLALLVAGLALLEDDYLGGGGSRGYGRVAFAKLEVSLAHDGGVSPAVRELVGALAGKSTVAEALKAAGSPLESPGA